MIKKFPTIVFVFIISFALCGNNEKYSFIVNGGRVADVGTKWNYKNTHETSFSIPEIGFVKYSGQYIDRMEYMGIEGEFWRATMNTMIITVSVVTISLFLGTLGAYALSRSTYKYTFWINNSCLL